MSNIKWNTLINQANTVIDNVKQENKIGVSGKWGYYFAKGILNPKKDITKITIEAAKNSNGTSISRDIYMSSYKDMATRLVKYVEENHQLPNNVRFTTKSNKNYYFAVSSYTYFFATILSYFDKNKKLPQPAHMDTKVFKKAETAKNNCTNPYTSSPHYTNQGAGALGQITPYDCGPHCIHQGLKKFGVTNISESELMAYCGTTTSGTSHEGINTGIAKAAKKAGIKIKVEWKNFSDLGKTEAERFKALGELICKKNIFAFCHLWYSCAGECIDDDDACGHYEAADKVNIKTGYIRALNSLGARQGNGYYGHLQDRKFSIQSHYIAGISQKSICIMTKV